MRSLFFLLAMTASASALAPVNVRHLITPPPPQFPNNCHLACSICKCPVDAPRRTH